MSIGLQMFLPEVEVFDYFSGISQDLLVSLLLLLVLKCSSSRLLQKFNRSRKRFSNMPAVPFQAWNIVCSGRPKRTGKSLPLLQSQGLLGGLAGSKEFWNSWWSHTFDPQYLHKPLMFLTYIYIKQIFLNKWWIGRWHSCTSIKLWMSIELVS